MRLLQSDSRGGFTLTQTGAGDIPTYAILSHTWGEEEVTFRDMVNGSGNKKKGYKKIQFCGRQADRDGLEFFWVDTCCIDKSSSAELSESINSMFQWYKEAKICYVFLSDVQSRQHHSQFEKEFWQSRWFTRGWTLQELVAPRNVEFYNAQWEHIGSKLEHKLLISRITGIDIRVLEGADPAICNVAQRMSWASARNTTRVEDRAYSLLGLFHVNMPMIYGEKENAFIRLQEEIIKNSEDYSLFAWHDHEIDKGSSLKSIYRGVLAYSPANF
ncbi:HET-domain-containing protein, partial [Lojkania enalia]